MEIVYPLKIIIITLYKLKDIENYKEKKHSLCGTDMLINTTM